MTVSPARLVERFNTAQAAYRKAEEAMNASFEPRIRAAIAAGAIDEAARLTFQMPASVSRTIMVDALRQAGWVNPAVKYLAPEKGISA